jgi:hypothetical protein
MFEKLTMPSEDKVSRFIYLFWVSNFDKIKTSYNCEDIEIYTDPLKEIFICVKIKNNLTTTIHYNQNKKIKIINYKN